MGLYTKVGDEGTTRTITGKVVAKDNCLIEFNGALDSLQAQLDKVIYSIDILPTSEDYIGMLKKIQQKLLLIGGEVSGQKVENISDEDVSQLEEAIDVLATEITEFVRFVNPAGMEVNEARVRARQVEREATMYLREFFIYPNTYKYLNRLSDYLFAVAVDLEVTYEV